MKMNPTLKKGVCFALKLLIAAAIVFVLFRRSQQGIRDSFRNFDCRYLIPALFFYRNGKLEKKLVGFMTSEQLAAQLGL